MAAAVHHDRNRSTAIVKSITVYRTEDDTRLLPLAVDETLTMAVEFNLPNDFTCDKDASNNKLQELSQFLTKYRLFTSEELTHVLEANDTDLYNRLSRCIPCVGCRRSVEELYGHLVEFDIPALDPVILKNGLITLASTYAQQHDLLFSLFSKFGSRLNGFINSIPMVKKSKRCIMHSLDSQKLRQNRWLDIWDLMDSECKEEVLIIERENLLTTVEMHLTQNRFCGECKLKVLMAFDLLVGNVDPKNEKEYAPSVYSGICYCPEEKHIHVANNSDFVAKLIRRSERDLKSSHGQKHARTVDVAQEEILVCIGKCIDSRLLRINQRLREEGQTWQTLFLLCTECLQTNFEIAVETKQGYSQLDVFCKEISMKKGSSEEKRLCKQTKRKSKKGRSSKRRLNKECLCTGNRLCKMCKEKKTNSESSSEKGFDTSLKHFTTVNNSRSSSVPTPHSSPFSTPRMSPCFSCIDEDISILTESGYSSSGVEWNSSSSCNSSEVTCSCKNDDCDIPRSKQTVQHCSLSETFPHDVCSKQIRNKQVGRGFPDKPTSLEYLLKVFSPSAEDCYIPEAELLEMKAKVLESTRERLQFRETLKHRFANLQQLGKFRITPFAFRHNEKLKL